MRLGRQHFYSFLVSVAGLVQISNGVRLVNFQVSQPPPVPRSTKQCTIQILQRDFASSYGHPEIVHFQPPTECGEPGSWAAVTLNFTVTSKGTQYDRLGIFTFQNVEIWRTSTPEPIHGDGIIWTHMKDATRYMPLFSKQGPFILQLDNNVFGRFDGIYSTVLHAVFYASSYAQPAAQRADLIVPISNMREDTGNEVSVPPAFSLNVTLPRNTIKVFAELYASGNGDEEFWYYNTANQYLPHLPPGFLGQGPFREVRLMVDGQIAGAAYPYPVIFSGGIVPSSWRPITAYGALDLPTYYIDVTPFVPILTDGEPHIFTIDVTSAEADHNILQNWYLSGNLQVYLDQSSKPTSGKILRYEAEPFSHTTTIGRANGSDVLVTVSATRKIYIESTVTGGSGYQEHIVFDQDLEYKNVQHYGNNANVQNVAQSSFGRSLSMHNGKTILLDRFSFPLGINYTNLDPDGTSWKAVLDHSYNRELQPVPHALKTRVENRQTATGYFFIHPGGNFGNGTNNNVFNYTDSAGNTYYRKVKAALNLITYDEESGTLGTQASRSYTTSGFDGSDGQELRLPHARRVPSL